MLSHSRRQISSAAPQTQPVSVILFDDMINILKLTSLVGDYAVSLNLACADTSHKSTYKRIKREIIFTRQHSLVVLGVYY